MKRYQIFPRNNTCGEPFLDCRAVVPKEGGNMLPWGGELLKGGVTSPKGSRGTAAHHRGGCNDWGTTETVLKTDNVAI